jgi:hypothetical protein
MRVFKTIGSGKLVSEAPRFLDALVAPSRKLKQTASAKPAVVVPTNRSSAASLNITQHGLPNNSSQPPLLDGRPSAADAANPAAAASSLTTPAASDNTTANQQSSPPVLINPFTNPQYMSAGVTFVINNKTETDIILVSLVFAETVLSRCVWLANRGTVIVVNVFLIARRKVKMPSFIRILRTPATWTPQSAAC